MTQSPAPLTPFSTAPPARGGGCAVLPLLALGGAVACLLTGQLSALLAAALPGGASLAGGVAAYAAPLLFLLAVATWRSRNPRRRAMLRTWLLAAPFPLLLIPATLARPVDQQLAVQAQGGLTLLYLGFLWLVLQRQGARGGAHYGGLAFAMVLAAPLAFPWVALGALGSLSDVALNLAAGLLFGVAAAYLIGQSWLSARLLQPPGTGFSRLGDGAVIGATLAILACNFGFHGASLPEVAVLPWLGWLAVSVAEAGLADPREAGRRWPALAVLFGVAAALPLLFSDTDVLSPETLFGEMEGLAWAMRAAALTALVALGLSFVAPWLRRVPAGVAALALWAVAGVIFGSVGHPGLYGDRLFVILKAQADVSSAAGLGDYDERRRTVYRTLVEQAERTQAPLRQRLAAMGVGYTPYYLVNALEVRGDPVIRTWLMAQPEIDRVLPSPHLRPLPRPGAPPSGNEPPPAGVPWNVAMTGAPRVWAEFGARGQGIVIGQSDSGVAWEHPELHDGYRGLRPDGTASHDYNWFDPWNGTAAPTDPGGHGTHTLGIALGRHVGVAPAASWIGCTNLARNIGNPAVYLDCMQFMLAPFPLGGDPFRDGDATRSAHVLNNSWGCPRSVEGCDPTSLLPAVRALRAAGIFVVASAGNDGPNCGTIDAPISLYREVLTVGAVGRDGVITDFSSTGPVTADGSNRLKPDVMAPGADVVSSYPNNTYYQGSGTSQAGPHVAGVVALLWSANPALIGNIDRTEQLLNASAAPYQGAGRGPGRAGSTGCAAQTDTTTVPNPVTGYGLIDAYHAVQLGR